MEKINDRSIFRLQLYRRTSPRARHAEMLAKQGIIAADDARKNRVHGLDTILSEIGSGKFNSSAPSRTSI